MIYIRPEDISEARKVDLLTYLRTRDPGELVKCSGGYTTRTHDSLKISNGMWMWWSRGIGGKNALDYLMKVKGMEFPDAVSSILGKSFIMNNEAVSLHEEERVLQLPCRSEPTGSVEGYLRIRGIDPAITTDCIDRGLIFESLPHHNAVFVGKDETGKVRYAAYRATNRSRFMGDCPGSDKRFSFRLTNPDSTSVHVFESAIDALSYATLINMNGGDYRNESLLSLAGIYSPGSDGNGKLPSALVKFLQESPGINKVCLHLDNDRAGREATEMIRNSLGPEYTVSDRPPKYGKDFNDHLIHRIRTLDHRKRSYER